MSRPVKATDLRKPQAGQIRPFGQTKASSNWRHRPSSWKACVMSCIVAMPDRIERASIDMQTSRGKSPIRESHKRSYFPKGSFLWVIKAAYQNAFPLLRAIPGWGVRPHSRGSLPRAAGCRLPIESESLAGSAVTGLGLRERLAAPVAKTRDVTFSCSRWFRSRPDEPLSRNHRKIVAELEAGQAPWVQPWGMAAAKTAAGHPEEHFDPSPVFGNQCPNLWGAVIERGFPARAG